MVAVTTRAALVVLWLAGAWALVAERPPAGHNDAHTLTHAGRERGYTVHVPSGYDGSKPLPLVIVLHGGGGNGSNIERTSGFSAKADEEGFLVAYPDGTGAPTDRLLTWNSGNCCGYALDNRVDDVGFLRAMVARIEKDYKMDPKRVYATGISNGGMMAYRLACAMPEKLAAIAPVAGAMNCEERPKRPVSVIIFHGTADEHVLYEGGEPKTRADRHERTDRSVAYAARFWAKYNGCAAEPEREEKGAVLRETYSGGRDGTAVVVVTIKGGKHSWPGGVRGRLGGDPPSRAVNATDEMWEFFKSHPKSKIPLAGQ